jgi:hypothetical protein
MPIMTLVRLVFHVCGIDGDTTSLFLGSLINIRIVDEGSTSFESHNLRYRRGEGGLQSKYEL